MLCLIRVCGKAMPTVHDKEFECVGSFVRLLIRKSKDYVYGISVYKVHGIWKGYYSTKVTTFMHETVNRGKK